MRSLIAFKYRWSPRSMLGRLLCVWAVCMASPTSVAPAADDVFKAFTAHIHRQIQADKRTFLDAQVCTEWFYEQLREQQPDVRPETASFSLPARPISPESDCQARYPGGLDSARQDFGRTQSTLSLSLTFYQFALVADGDDDTRYSSVELRDLLESLRVSYGPQHPPAVHLAALNEAFDTMHNTGAFDPLINGMDALLEKGYRLTPQDKSDLQRITG